MTTSINRGRRPSATGELYVTPNFTINQSGGLIVRAEKVGRDTMLSQIVQLGADA